MVEAKPTGTTAPDFDRRWIIWVLKCLPIPDDIMKYIYRQYLTTLESAPWVPAKDKIRTGGFCGKHRRWMYSQINPLQECPGCWQEEQTRLVAIS